MLSTTSQYALRAMVELARLPRGRALLGRDLAQSAEIPVNYLSKILLALRNAGLLATARGSGGGYRLKKSPEQIYLIDIVELFEIIRRKPTCFLAQHRECSDRNPCSAHAILRDVRAAFIGVLVATSLSSIAQSESGLGSLPARGEFADTNRHK